jgi:hypothetical protein
MPRYARSVRDLHLQEDKAHATVAALKVGTDTAARPFVRLLASTMHETGRRLWECQAASLGAFVLDSASGGAERLVAHLASALPAFCDPPFHAKAVRLCCELRRRYAAEAEGREQFALLDVDELPAPADAPLVLALASRGALCVPPGASAARLRAAAVVLVAELRSAVGPGAASPAAVAHWIVGDLPHTWPTDADAALLRQLSVGRESNVAY